MDEVVPGLFHWSAFHEGIRMDVHSHFAAESATLVDPMVPPEGLDWFERRASRPERIVLTNRHHYRQSARFVEAFGCPVLCHEAGLHEFTDGREVRGFAFGDEVAPGITAHEVGALTPEDTALLIAAGGGALAFADGVIRGRHGEIGFVPEELMGDDPRQVREGLRANLRRLLELNFDALLFAHGGPPVTTGGRSALRTLVDVPTAGAPPA